MRRVPIFADKSSWILRASVRSNARALILFIKIVGVVSARFTVSVMAKTRAPIFASLASCKSMVSEMDKIRFPITEEIFY